MSRWASQDLLLSYALRCLPAIVHWLVLGGRVFYPIPVKSMESLVMLSIGHTKMYVCDWILDKIISDGW